MCVPQTCTLFTGLYVDELWASSSPFMCSIFLPFDKAPAGCRLHVHLIHIHEGTELARPKFTTEKVFLLVLVLLLLGVWLFTPYPTLLTVLEQQQSRDAYAVAFRTTQDHQKNAFSVQVLFYWGFLFFFIRVRATYIHYTTPTRHPDRSRVGWLRRYHSCQNLCLSFA